MLSMPHVCWFISQVIADATGSRVGGFSHSAKNVIVVAGSNKIVPTHDDAVA